MNFTALVTRQAANGGGVASSVETVEESALPAGNVLVAVEWAGLNYKDALVLTGRGNLVKSYPHVGGIDFAGRVLESDDRRYAPGQAVVLTGWRVGETRWGGYAQRARVDADMLVPLPKGFSTRASMMLGTAGLAAMLAINRIRADGHRPDAGEVLVTGAGGGVGTLAVMLLAQLGYKVAALTGRAELGEQLTRLGATRIVSRDEVLQPTGRVLDKETWVACIDNVGGPLLGEVLKKIRRGGMVAAVGNAGGHSWEASIIPFILRGITLSGIDTVMQPFEARQAAWERLTALFTPAAYEPLLREVQLEALPALAVELLAGKVAGRVLVDLRETAAQGAGGPRGP
jgi:acrylyl-CoA reductase (NADPH)